MDCVKNVVPEEFTKCSYLVVCVGLTLICLLILVFNMILHQQGNLLQETRVKGLMNTVGQYEYNRNVILIINAVS